MIKPNKIKNLHDNIRDLIIESHSAVAKTVDFVSVIQN